MQRGSRVLAVGLSEATWTLIRDPKLAAQLPCLHALTAKGATGSTVAPQPLVSETMWGTVVTGRTPKSHGLVGSVRRDGNGGTRVFSASDFAAPPVWRILEDQGLPTGTFNLKLTDRAEPVRGFMIARDSVPTIQARHVHPPELHRDLTERFGTFTTTTLARTREDWTSMVPREIETRGDVLVHLLKTRPWSFVLAQWPEISRVQHRFWKDTGDTLRNIYAAADRVLARLLDAAGPDTLVFVFSECGAGPIRHGVQVEAWLEQEGFLRRKRSTMSKAALAFVRAVGAVRRMLPTAINTRAQDLRIRARNILTATDIDRRRSRAYSPALSGEIYFNVPPSERDALADELRARLLTLRDPEGHRVVEDVIRGESPDLTIVWDDDAYMPAEKLAAQQQIFVDWCDTPDWPLTGSHRREGMLVAHGPGIARTDLGRIPTQDLVPTWLELLGVAVPDSMEGSSFAARLRA